MPGLSIGSGRLSFRFFMPGVSLRATNISSVLDRRMNFASKKYTSLFFGNEYDVSSMLTQFLIVLA